MVFAVAVLLAASPTPIKLASPGLAGVNVTPEMLAFVTDHVNQQLAIEGLEVLSSAQVAAVLGFDRQKQLLGCSSDSNCIAEIGNALGVDGLVLGNLAKLGEAFQLDVRVAAASDAKTLAVFSIAIQSEAGLLDGISKAATAIATQLSAALQRTLARKTVLMERRATTARKIGGVTFLGSVVLVTVGVGLIFGGTPAEGKTSTPAQDAIFATGMGMGTVGLVGLIIGGVLWLAGGSEEVPVTAGLVPTQHGFSFALSGHF